MKTLLLFALPVFLAGTCAASSIAGFNQELQLGLQEVPSNQDGLFSINLNILNNTGENLYLYSVSESAVCVLTCSTAFVDFSPIEKDFAAFGQGTKGIPNGGEVSSALILQFLPTNLETVSINSLQFCGGLNGACAYQDLYSIQDFSIQIPNSSTPEPQPFLFVGAGLVIFVLAWRQVRREK